MKSVLIVGSGPAAAGAALAATAFPDVKVTVIDVGGTLERENDEARARLAGEPSERWSAEDLATITKQPVASDAKGLPEKRAFGSDFSFRDFGQRRGVLAEAANAAVISGAFGGFSNSWGAQFMPFTVGTFGHWPVSATEMRPHYEQVLRRIPFAAESDDLEGLFPILKAGPHPLPRLSDRSLAVLARYEPHSKRLNRAGVMLGRARLAFNGTHCVRCGLCMTGCPYGLIYSAAQTFAELRRESAIDYHDGLLALSVEENGESATVLAKELDTGRVQRFTADRVLLACGAIGTARIVMRSLNLFGVTAPVLESRQFRLPFLSVRPVSDPRQASDFTLNQFNMVVTHDEAKRDVSQLHFYTYNQAFVDALPSAVRDRRARRFLLRRLSIALGYLPSWASPSFSISVRPPAAEAESPEVVLKSSAGELPSPRNPMVRDMVRRVTASAPALDLWPILPAMRMSAGGKSYHWGGIFPHESWPGSRFSSDTLGRVQPWRRIHLVDSSVFPDVPATTFALTVMANAHRIAEGALGAGEV